MSALAALLIVIFNDSSLTSSALNEASALFVESVVSISLINLVNQRDAIGGKIQSACICARVYVSMLSGSCFCVYVDQCVCVNMCRIMVG